jgi:hypothetical protein
MTRRLFALLALPAVALGFAAASPATDQAHAYSWLSPDTVCAIARSQINIAHNGGDDGAADVFYGNAVAYGLQRMGSAPVRI